MPMPSFYVRFRGTAEVGRRPARAGHDAIYPQQTCSEPLLDHLVSARDKHWWYFEAERLGGLEIDYELEPGRSHQREVGRLFPP
jgi:hypothetical protein